MAIIDIVRLIKFDELTDEQRETWMEKLNERKRELEAAIAAVDKGLAALAVKPGRKRTARRKVVRRPTKR